MNASVIVVLALFISTVGHSQEIPMPKNQAVYSDAQARLEVEKLYRQIGEGAAIENLAEDASQDPGTFLRGGVLGFVDPVERGYVDEFVTVVQTLKVGETSKPFRTDFGYRIVKLLARNKTKLLLQHLLIRVAD